jgi:hypothetical protein
VDKGTALGEEARETLTQEVNAALATGFERTNVQDVGFGFGQLVDVAVRALSPGINDPTTAVHVIGHLLDLLCRLAERNPGPEHLTDDDGRIRVVLSLPTLRDLLNIAMDQPRKYEPPTLPSRTASWGSSTNSPGATVRASTVRRFGTIWSRCVSLSSLRIILTRSCEAY